MKKLNPMTDLGICYEDVEKINALIERDTAKAIVEDDKYNICYCPACKHVLLNGDVFCSRCGQRIDAENRSL